MAHDHVHEQLNAMVKGDGGVIGITENDETLRRWMVGGPETARLLLDYSNKHDSKTMSKEEHHEQIASVQKPFAINVKKTCAKSLKKQVTPFLTQVKPCIHWIQNKSCLMLLRNL